MKATVATLILVSLFLVCGAVNAPTLDSLDARVTALEQWAQRMGAKY